MIGNKETVRFNSISDLFPKFKAIFSEYEYTFALKLEPIFRPKFRAPLQALNTSSKSPLTSILVIIYILWQDLF